MMSPGITNWERLRGPAAAFALLLVGGLVAEGLLANGGTLRIANAAVGAYRASAFTDPTPVRPDTLDVSVLVVRGDDGRVVEGLDVRVRADPLDADGVSRTVAATREAADDPRYYAAKFSLGAPGRWLIAVSIDGPEGTGELEFELRAREWGILANPLFVILVSLIPLALAGWWLLRGGDEEERGTGSVSPAARPEDPGADEPRRPRGAPPKGGG